MPCHHGSPLPHLQVDETPAEFAAQIKRNLLAQLSKWEIDRAALQAVVASAGDNAADAAKVRVNSTTVDARGTKAPYGEFRPENSNSNPSKTLVWLRPAVHASRDAVQLLECVSCTTCALLTAEPPRRSLQQQSRLHLFEVYGVCDIAIHSQRLQNLLGAHSYLHN